MQWKIHWYINQKYYVGNCSIKVIMIALSPPLFNDVLLSYIFKVHFSYCKYNEICSILSKAF